MPLAVGLPPLLLPPPQPTFPCGGANPVRAAPLPPDEVLMDAVRGASLFSTVHTTAVSSYFAYAKAVSLMLATQVCRAATVSKEHTYAWVEVGVRARMRRCMCAHVRACACVSPAGE